MRKLLKKYQYQKVDGMYYLKKDEILYCIGVIKLLPFSKLLIKKYSWELRNSLIPKGLPLINKSHFIPDIYTRLQNENINLVRILVIKGRHIDIEIAYNGRKELLENGQVVNGIYIVNLNRLAAFLNEFGFLDQVKEYELSF